MTSYLQSCVYREKSLTKILNNAPDEHIALVDKMQKSLRIAQKSNSNMLKEIAVTQAVKLKEQCPSPQQCFLHRKDGDIDFINTFLKEMETIQVGFD